MDSAKVTDAPVVKKRKTASLTAKKARVGWVFVLPFIIGLIILYIGVIIESIEYSFATYTTIPAVKGGGYSLTWVGLENYANILPKTVNTETGETFIEMMFTGFGSQLVEVVAIILLSLFLAVILNQKMIGRAAFRAIFFLPVVVGAGIIAQIDFSNALLESMSSTEAISTGAVQTSAMSAMVDAMDISMLFQNLGFGSELVEVVTTLVGNIYDIVNRAGVQMLIFLAGLQSISPSIYESCQMEGATAWEMFWKITLPMISPMILANAVYTVIDSFTAESNSVMTYILSLGSSVSPSGQQAAAAWSYFIVVIVMLVLAYLILGRVIYYDRRNDS
jgi:ABC-type sugar transport system permease subunit